MKHINFFDKIFILSSLFSIVILCGVIFFAASNGTGNIVHLDALDFDDICRMKEIEIKSSLGDFDKVNNILVTTQNSDSEVRAIYIAIVLNEGLSDSEKDNISEFVLGHFESFKEKKIHINYYTF